MKSEDQFLSEFALGMFSFHDGEKLTCVDRASLDRFCHWLAKQTGGSFTLLSAAVCQKLQDKIETVVESLTFKFDCSDIRMQQWMDRTFNVKTIGRCENVMDVLKVLADSAKREGVCSIVDFSKL